MPVHALRVLRAALPGLAAALLTAGWAAAAEPLVISTWGGSWKDTIERVVAKPFTEKTGIPVEFEVGGTIDRLAKARVNKARPQVHITLTTTHVARLYISDGLFEKLDFGRLPSSKALYKEAFRSDYHIGAWAYVFTIAYRTDKGLKPITRWADLWDPSLARKIALPDFDPSHIITASARLEGGDEFSWEKGQERLKRLKPNAVAFYQTDAQIQDLLKTGEAQVAVILSINAFHLQEQGLPIAVVSPTDVGGILGIDSVGVMANSGRSKDAHAFIDLMLSRPVQEELVKAFKAGPTNREAQVPAALKGQPGVFTSPEEWRTRGYIINDEQRAKLLPAWREWFTANVVR